MDGRDRAGTLFRGEIGASVMERWLLIGVVIDISSESAEELLCFP